MNVIYSVALGGYKLIIYIASFFGNTKANQWIKGRENWCKKLAQSLLNNNKPVLWIHASSTGEFEQGRTVIEQLRKEKENYFFLLTFFSPSGYMQHSDYEYVDTVQYLPLDGSINAQKFLDVTNPSLAIFIKYEFWYYYFSGLTKRNIPLFLVSAKLTTNHLFFKWYGRSYRKVLEMPTHFFVQDESTKNLLNRLDVERVTVTGDTRADRVIQIAKNVKKLKTIELFLKGEKAIIFGSSWGQEESFLIKWLNSGNCNYKVIIAPHEINQSKINHLEKKVSVKTIRYSALKDNNSLALGQLLIIDCVGILKETYQYGEWAFVGGGFSDGIHNILEPIVFGLPVLFGPKYHKFTEAVDLLERGGGACVLNYAQFLEQTQILSNDEVLSKKSSICENYILQSKGATKKVVQEINQYF